MSNNDIINSVVGGILASLAINIFLFSHRHQLNISDIFWALTSFRQKWLPQYLPLISGIFFMSGMFFNIFGYKTLSGITPYGNPDQILARSSMYGFAISGFLIGLGSKFAEGDLIYHGLIGVAKFKLQSLVILILMLSFAIFWSWMLSFQGMVFLTNPEINPIMEFTHLQSANINIALAVVLLVVSTCWLKSIVEDRLTIIKKIVCSFISGSLLALAFMICGYSRRKMVIQSLLPSSSWNPSILIFLGTVIFINIIVYQLVYKLLILKDESLQGHFLFEPTQESIKWRKLVGGCMFGSGWGIGGLQLTTYFIHSAIFSVPIVLIFGLFLVLGTMIGDTFEQDRLKVYTTKDT